MPSLLWSESPHLFAANFGGAAGTFGWLLTVRKFPPRCSKPPGCAYLQIACYSACGGACCWSSCRSRCRRLRDRSRAVSLPSWASPKGGSATSCRVPVVLSGLLWYCGCCSSTCIRCLSTCPLLPHRLAPFPSMDVHQHRLQALPNTSFNERLKCDSGLGIGISTRNNDFSAQGLDRDNGIIQLHPYIIGGKLLFSSIPTYSAMVGKNLVYYHFNHSYTLYQSVWMPHG